MSWAIWITSRPGSGKLTPAVDVADAVQGWPVTLKVLDPADAVAAGPGIALDHGEAVHPEPGLRIHVLDFQSPVDDMPLLGRRLHRGAATTVTHAERNVP